MDEVEKPESQPMAWYPTNRPCPRCNQPTAAKGTRNFRRLTRILCKRCGWNLEIEEIRKSIQATISIDEDLEASMNEAAKQTKTPNETTVDDETAADNG